MTIDTGAQKTVVSADLVELDEYTGESIRLLGFNGEAVNVPLAMVWLHFGDYVFQHAVAVCKDSPEQALLGLDIGKLDYLMQLEKEQREKREHSSKFSVNVTTRAQAKARMEQDRENETLSAKDQANPIPVAPEPKQIQTEIASMGVDKGVLGGAEAPPNFWTNESSGLWPLINNPHLNFNNGVGY